MRTLLRSLRVVMVPPMLAISVSCGRGMRPELGVPPYPDSVVVDVRGQENQFRRWDAVSLARVALVPCAKAVVDRGSMRIGPAGGTLALPRAGHSLHVPENAVATEREFQLGVISNKRFLIVRAEPHVQFADSVTLTLNFAPCETAPEGLLIARLRPVGNTAEALGGTVSGNTISVRLMHLSEYALATQ